MAVTEVGSALILTDRPSSSSLLGIGDIACVFFGFWRARRGTREIAVVCKRTFPAPRSNTGQRDGAMWGVVFEGGSGGYGYGLSCLLVRSAATATQTPPGGARWVIPARRFLRVKLTPRRGPGEHPGGGSGARNHHKPFSASSLRSLFQCPWQCDRCCCCCRRRRRRRC